LNDIEQMKAWGIKPKDAMDITINTMSAMAFTWGFVHCDPHPGNILVRPHPTKKGKPQIVRGDYRIFALY
jgi:aarF domain-containing kinase